MKKNVASQVIGAQMITAADGTAFTGSVTVSVLGDGGTQATGSVGSGACTHEGNGFHSYAPAQAETNYDHVAFTFTGTGAIPVTVQVYTQFPQAGDAFGRLGAPAGASVSADIAAVKAETAAILVDTGTTLDGKLDTIDNNVDAILVDTAEIGAAGAGLTAIPWNAAWDAEVQSEATDALNAYDPPTKAELDSAVAPLATSSALGTVDTVVDAIKLKTDNLPSDPADASVIAGRFDTLDASVADLPTNSELATALGGADDAVLAAIATVDGNVDAIKATTDKLDDTLEDQGGGTYGFTEAALQEAPSGGGGGGPSASEIADEVETRTIAGVTTVGTVNALANNSITAAALNSDAVTEIQSGLATASAVADLPTNAELATALGTADDAVLAQVALVKAKTDLIPGTMDGLTFEEVTKLVAAVLLGKASGMGTTTGIFRAADDSKDRVTATIDADGNRSAVTLDAS